MQGTVECHVAESSAFQILGRKQESRAKLFSFLCCVSVPLLPVLFPALAPPRFWLETSLVPAFVFRFFLHDIFPCECHCSPTPGKGRAPGGRTGSNYRPFRFALLFDPNDITVPAVEATDLFAGFWTCPTAAWCLATCVGVLSLPGRFYHDTIAPRLPLASAVPLSVSPRGVGWSFASRVSEHTLRTSSKKDWELCFPRTTIALQYLSRYIA